MALMRPAARMQPVEVMDEDQTVTVGTPGARVGSTQEPVDPHRVLLLLRRWWPVPALAVMALVATSVVAAERDQARSDRVAAIAGMVRPLEGIPEVRWAAPAEAGDQVLVAAGGIVVVNRGQDTWRVVSREADSGVVRWQVDLQQSDRAAMQGGEVSCPEQGTDVGPVVACILTVPSAVYRDDGDDSAAQPARVVALASDDGRELGSWSFEGSLLSSGRVAEDVVLATVDADGHLVVVRHDGVTGEPRWSYRSPEVIEGLATLLLSSLEMTPDLVLFEGSSSTILSMSDGAVVFSAPLYTFVAAEPFGGGFGTWSSTHGGQLHDRGGAEGVSIPGLPAKLRVDDRSEPGLVVLDLGRDVIAIDGSSGAQRWRTSETGLDPYLLVDHTLVAESASRYVVVDALTGQTLWGDDLGQPLPWLPLSDGAVVLAPGIAPSGQPEMVARGLRDGVRYWSVLLPNDLYQVSATGGALLVRSTTEVRVIS